MVVGFGEIRFHTGSAAYSAQMGRLPSLIRVTVAYLVAVAAGFAWLAWGPDTGRLWLDTLIADLLATVVIFAASRLVRNSSMYDAYWSVIPPLIAIYWWVAGSGGVASRWWLLMLVMLIWAVRLTANWVYTFPGLHHEDWRYPMLRDRVGRFELPVDLLAIHVFPTLQVFVGLIPVYVVATRGDRPLGGLDVVALVVGLVAVAVETVADLQMHRFATTKSPGQVMDTGLWSWSRHPNYFGEFGVCLSFALF